MCDRKWLFEGSSRQGGGVFASEAVQQNRAVTGVVKDATGEPMIGVTIRVKGTGNGTVTDIDGKYTLNVSGNNAILVFSFVGYQSQEISVGGRSSIDVVLKEDSEMIDEVVVVGFGTQKKVNLTGAVASVNNETIENKPVGSLGQALEGVIPNLNVSATSGDPTSVPTFNVRGGTSMGQNDDGDWVIQTGSPLILVDGVQMDATALSMLNPADVESVSLLKDAASAAIYGARAT